MVRLLLFSKVYFRCFLSELERTEYDAEKNILLDSFPNIPEDTTFVTNIEEKSSTVNADDVIFKTLQDSSTVVPTTEEVPEVVPKGEWPFIETGRNGVRNIFFPVVFGNAAAKGRSGEKRGFGGLFASISNSFSTGKGGIASSHVYANGAYY